MSLVIYKVDSIQNCTDISLDCPLQNKWSFLVSNTNSRSWTDGHHCRALFSVGPFNIFSLKLQS